MKTNKNKEKNLSNNAGEQVTETQDMTQEELINEINNLMGTKFQDGAIILVALRHELKYVRNLTGVRQ